MANANEEAPVVLVVGSCGIDRLISVPSYPEADSKVRSSSYHENGGGNAANTAAAFARLSRASFARLNRNSATDGGVSSTSPHRIRVKLLTKIGGDAIGQALCEELRNDGVDLSSPLFICEANSTSPVTTVIVSTNDNTRTCFHTPGSCGQISSDDVRAADLEEVFRNAVLLHSDTRHTGAAALLAKEAHTRGIPVSIDAERYRGDKMEDIIKVSSLFFVNEKEVGNYLSTSDRRGVESLPAPVVSTSDSVGAVLNEEEVTCCARSAALAYALNGRKQQDVTMKEVIVTRGENGSQHVSVERMRLHDKHNKGFVPGNVKHEMLVTSDRVQNSAASDCVTIAQSIWRRYAESRQEETCMRNEVTYALRRVGVMKDCDVVDTTGAGDVFIAGYLLCWIVGKADQNNFPCICDDSKESIKLFCLHFATWVAGKKLSGVGARRAVPQSGEVDKVGEDVVSLFESIKLMMTRDVR